MFGKRKFTNLGLSLLIGGACACSQEKAATTGIDFDPAGYDGFDETHFNLLAADCSFDVNGDMTITVDADETAYLFKRAADGLVVANANIAGVECTVAITKKITVTSHSLVTADDQKVIVDFYGGTFGLATVANTPKLVITLGAGTGDTVKIRGTPLVDTFTLGTHVASSTTYAAFQAAPATARTFPDMSMTGVENIVVSTGAGNDIITAQGGAVVGSTTGTPVVAVDGAISLALYGGDDNDTITSGALSVGAVRNLLSGGAGNDYFPQQTALAADSISGGGGIDTVDYGNRTSAIRASLGASIAAAAATGSFTAVAKDSLADNDSFTLDDGVNDPVTFAYQKTADVAAMGTITCVAKANLVDNDYFILHDGTNDVTFEYNVSGTASATHGGTLINVNAATDDVSVAALTQDAIALRHGVGLTITAAEPTTAVISLTNDADGAAGNEAIEEFVANAGFLVTGMAGGSAFVESAENIAAGAVIIDVSAVTTAIAVAAATYTEINTSHSANDIDITPTNPAGGTEIVLTHDTSSAVGNVTIVTSAGVLFTVEGMSGGVTEALYDDGDIAGTEHDSLAADVENIIGSSAGDTIDASNSPVAHVLMGMGGNDTLTGAGLVDYIYGGPGNDTIIGDASADYLFGGNDNDTLQGGLGNDVINGGGVNCLAAVSAASPIAPFVNTTVCTTTFAAAATSPGIDTLDYSDRAVAVTVDLTNLLNCTTKDMGAVGECDSLVYTGTGAAALANIRNIRGGSAGDNLTGDSRDNIIWGGDGGDTIDGKLGNDALYGEAGNDTITGGPDPISTGQTDNDYISGGSGTNTLNGGDGLDTIDSSMGTEDDVDCGSGDGDINLPSGDENSLNSCEL
jgi:Ca2+-binding RTX toxin-like protein